MGRRSELALFGDFRDLEAMRHLLREEFRHVSQRVLAGRIDIHRSSLRKFLRMSEPDQYTRRDIWNWAQDRPDPDLPLGATALGLLAADLPVPMRPAARGLLATTLTDLYLEVGQQPPPWLLEEVGCWGADARSGRETLSVP